LNGNIFHNDLIEYQFTFLIILDVDVGWVDARNAKKLIFYLNQDVQDLRIFRIRTQINY
jgi:hypothetical protein